jgi:ATP-dependent RNA helicase MSS116
MGLHRLTDVQEQTMEPILQGDSVVARSRTGTGKTLAFLIPSLERVIPQDAAQDMPGSRHHQIRILILAPTRELALQIHDQVERLLLFHQRSPDNVLSSQVVYGGTSKEQDIRQFQRQLPTILVATPGRLKDHLATTNLVFKSHAQGDRLTVPFRKCLGGLQTLVLDEMDRLLEMGFRRDIRDILSVIPKGNNSDTRRRQTLLFSATLPQDVLDVIDLAMPSSNDTENKQNYQYIDCIQEEDPTTHTNENTRQSYMILPSKRFWTGSMEYILNLLDDSSSHSTGKPGKKKQNVKVMVFFPTTRLVQLYYKFLALRLGQSHVWELHGKMHQRERMVVARRFRNAAHGLLLTSDVSARGLDYPDVTHVVQIGAPPSRETYIHRVGRTGRAGKQGEGMLILPEMERDFLMDLDGLDVQLEEGIQQGLARAKISNRKLQSELGLLQQDIRSGQDKASMEKSLHMAYHAMISYYMQTCQDKHESLEYVISTVNQLVIDFGLQELPPIESSRAKSMGIELLAGLNVRKNWDETNWNDGTSWTDVPASVESHVEEFQRKPYGEFDDWFGVSKKIIQPPNNDGPKTGQGSSALWTAKNEIKQNRLKQRKMRMEDFQRFDFPGEIVRKK